MSKKEWMKEAAIGLTNQTPEAVKFVEKYIESHGGSIEHLPYSQVSREMTEKLREDSDRKRKG